MWGETARGLCGTRARSPDPCQACSAGGSGFSPALEGFSPQRIWNCLLSRPFPMLVEALPCHQQKEAPVRERGRLIMLQTLPNTLSQHLER